MTTYLTGQIVVRELWSTDAAASVRFYSEVIGWNIDAARLPDGSTYHRCSTASGRRACGILEGAPPRGTPFWALSISVEDVDASAGRAIEAGAAILVAPHDALGFGRYAMIADPQGARIALWRGARGDTAPNPTPDVGEVVWEQLNTGDSKAAHAFYESVCGWTRKPGHDPRIDVWSAGETQVASVMQAPPGVPAHWISYVRVDNLRAAHARAVQHGGKTMLDRIDVPGMGAIGMIQDTLGAVLGIFEAK